MLKSNNVLQKSEGRQKEMNSQGNNEFRKTITD